MDLALQWVRRRQRALARGVLAVFCLAWLQTAVVPCATANVDSSMMPAGGEHCAYCPPDASAPSVTDHAGTCAYPHEPQVQSPQVLHYGKPGTGIELKKGMTFTVEPMINAGKPQTRQLPDGWTVVTKDHSLSAQWEHTLAVTDDGFEILTPWPDA